MGDVGHGIHSELAIRLVLKFANEREHLVIWPERVTGSIERFRDIGSRDMEFV